MSPSQFGLRILTRQHEQKLPTSANDLRNLPMRCLHPNWLEKLQFHVNCEKCSMCRQRRAATLAFRIELEAMMHDQAAISLIGLSYRDEELPEGRTLVPAHATKFLKHIRMNHARKTGGGKLRYFYCGEYGSRFERPHFHVVLFGYPSCLALQTRMRRGNNSEPVCCSHCRDLYSVWGRGAITSSVARDPRAVGRYVSSYLTKGLSRADSERLNGRHKEFARWSYKPPLGDGMMHEYASAYLQHKLGDFLPDVPGALCTGKGRIRGIGRTLHRNVRRYAGLDGSTPTNVWVSAMERRELAIQAALAHGTTPEEMAAQVAAQREARLRALRVSNDPE